MSLGPIFDTILMPIRPLEITNTLIYTMSVFVISKVDSNAVERYQGRLSLQGCIWFAINTLVGLHPQARPTIIAILFSYIL